MKHCFLCRWSFGAYQITGDEECPMIPVLKCHPNGDIQNEKIAVKICPHYDADDVIEFSPRGKDEQ